MSVTKEIWEDALLLLASIRSALINRTRRYDKNGYLLKTEKDIMAALLSAGEITVDESERISLTTDEEQLDVARREFANRMEKHVS